MFIIASGEAVVEISPGQHALLKEGDFLRRDGAARISAP
jgi:hypothetical protein